MFYVYFHVKDKSQQWRRRLKQVEGWVFEFQPMSLKEVLRVSLQHARQ